MTHFIKARLGHTSLHTSHKPNPQSHLSTVKRCLLDDALGAVSNIGHNYIVGLVGSIAQEISLEHCLSIRQTVKQIIVSTDNSLKLHSKWQSAVGYLYHGMIFAHIGSAVKTEHIGASMLKIYVGKFLIHNCLLLGCKDNTKNLETSIMTKKIAAIMASCEVDTCDVALEPPNWH